MKLIIITIKYFFFGLHVLLHRSETVATASIVNRLPRFPSIVVMSRLSEIRRPNAALINAVEAIGILLRIPTRMTKSAYKVPSPSNYDETVSFLESNFSQVLESLASLESNGIPNDVASQLYRKLQQQPFDYEGAVNMGGLEARELFNILVYILDQLVQDPHRIPVGKTNILVIVDGSRPSYVALDIAAHIHQHGVCVVGALSYSHTDTYMGSHLTYDLSRRLKDQYKLEEKSFNIVPILSDSVKEIVDHVQKLISNYNCGIVAMGIDTSTANEDILALAVVYAAWNLPHMILLAKSIARVCEFQRVQSPRKYMICVKNAKDLDAVFSSVRSFINPHDTLVFAVVVESGNPIGDERDTRFGFGARFDKWASSKISTDELQPDRMGWNFEANQKLEEKMKCILDKSQIPGRVIVETVDPTKTVAQLICDLAFEQECDVLVLRRGVNQEVSRECLRRSHCNLLLTS